MPTLKISSFSLSRCRKLAYMLTLHSPIALGKCALCKSAAQGIGSSDIHNMAICKDKSLGYPGAADAVGGLD
jgi:hypothetical protein